MQAGMEQSWLANIYFEQSVGVIVTPAPIGLLIVVAELGKIAIFAVILFRVHTIRLILMTIPLMIVVVLLIVVSASLWIFGPQCDGRNGDWDDKSGTQQDCIQKTGHSYKFLLNFVGNCDAKRSPTSGSGCN
jgi:hypothetical protein